VRDGEIWDVLLRFHREVFLPDFERLMDESLGAGIRSFREEMEAGFAEIERRFDRIEGRAEERGPQR
jgi:hypothetical protein